LSGWATLNETAGEFEKPLNRKMPLPELFTSFLFERANEFSTFYPDVRPTANAGFQRAGRRIATADQKAKRLIKNSG
jgi:hypothetical protein